MASIIVRSRLSETTPEVMASERPLGLGLGEDTIHIILMWTSHGVECGFSNKRYPIGLHSGKVNGGTAYTRWFELEATLPPGATDCQATLLVANRAGGLSDDMARQWIRALDFGIPITVAPAAINSYQELANVVINKLGQAGGPAQDVINDAAVQKLIKTLLPGNADQICAFDKITIANPADLPIGVQTFSERVSAIGPRAIYRTVFDVKRV